MAIILTGKLQAIIHKPQKISDRTGEVIPEFWRIILLEESDTDVSIKHIKAKYSQQLQQWESHVGKSVQIPVRLFSPEKTNDIYFSLA